MPTNDSDAAAWLDPDAVLREEANEIHAGKQKPPKPAASKQGTKTPASGATADKTPAETKASAGGEKWDRISDDTVDKALYIALHARQARALCLSGGGVRSASFNVGVIEAFAVHPRPDTDKTKYGEAQADDHTKSFLSQFHYLSTVSGGGYIGSWLSAWIARDGYAKVWPRLIGRREHPENEPSEIVWLRSYSSFLTPRLGLLSADTWSAVALVIRNLVLNWLVIIPALCLALFAVKLVAILAYRLSGASGCDLLMLAASAVILLFLALRLALANRASCNPGIAETSSDGVVYRSRYEARAASMDTQQNETRRVGAGASEASFQIWCLLPALVSAFLFSLYLTVRYVKLGNEEWTLAWTVLLAAAIGAAIYVAAWIAARLQLALFRNEKNRPAQRGWWHWLRDLLAWLVAGVVYGAFIGVGIHMLATTLGQGELQILSDSLYADTGLRLSVPTLTMLALLVAGIPWIITAQLTAEMVFVGLTNWEPESDSDREWFGRSTGWFTVAAFAWFVVTVLVILGPPLAALLFAKLPWAKYGTAVLGGISAAASVLLGNSSKTAATDQAPQTSAWWVQLVLPVSTIVFLVLMVLGVSAAMDQLLFAHHLVESPLLGPGNDSDLETDRRWLLIGIGVVSVIAAISSGAVNINRFSIHSLYRNRLIRAYLGASHRKRAPNPFTGFDPFDNWPMAKLWPDKNPKGAENPTASKDPKDAKDRNVNEETSGDDSWRPFHIVNVALNVVNSKRLAWQERKAESFTASPLHCGTAANRLGYRRTKYYGGEGGLSLGTALAISGAAASPNMGYHSSPLVTLMLALFNVRLGWWLGNPGKVGAATFRKDGPRVAIMPFLTEMFGQTTDDRGFVYLSDGGHFENLGLYEMIRRRCGCIVISDAGCDPDYDFTDLGNAVRKIAIDLGVYISFSELREIKRRSKDNSVIKGAYYAIGEIDYKTAPERNPAPDGRPAQATLDAEREDVANGYILYIKPSYHGTESAGVVSYAAANAAFPHEPTFDLFYGESQFESYRTLGFEIVDSVLKEAKVKASEIAADASSAWKPSKDKLCDLIAALAPVDK